MPFPKDNRRYTYKDYCTWDDSERWELIEGVPYAMSPAPNQQHQEISLALTVQLNTLLKGKPCKLFVAPFDVRLNADGEDDTVCQPDLLVVCDQSKLDGKCCNGAPDLVVEILSPSTSGHDRIVKLELYRKAGIREYWIVDPDAKAIQVCVLEKGRYFINAYTEEDTLSANVLEGLELEVKSIFWRQER